MGILKGIISNAIRSGKNGGASTNVGRPASPSKPAKLPKGVKGVSLGAGPNRTAKRK